ncbi:hypothetical protein KC957_01645 [Candidatus Saccharibacteria bacterium]|nr:hypothetical protein [Candidatus Saccharibacteria bacterium]
MNSPVKELLERVDLRNRQPAHDFWHDLCTYLAEAPGSTRSHHAWPMGYHHHVQETMNLAVMLYDQLNRERPLPFSLGSALLVLFLHDCEKPFRHATDTELAHFHWVKSRPDKSDKTFQQLLIDHYGFKISPDEHNALLYVEGEGSDYVEGTRLQGPLAAFCHVCDTISARIWYDFPEH